MQTPSQHRITIVLTVKQGMSINQDVDKSNFVLKCGMFIVQIPDANFSLPSIKKAHLAKNNGQVYMRMQKKKNIFKIWNWKEKYTF